MAYSNVPIFTQSIGNAAVNIVSTGAATPVSLVAGGTNGAKVSWVNCYTTDTSANTVTFYLYNGSTSYPLTVVTVPASSGTTGSTVPFTPFLNSQLPFLTFDSNGNKYLYLAPSWSLYVSAAAVTSAKTLTITAEYELF